MTIVAYGFGIGGGGVSGSAGCIITPDPLEVDVEFPDPKMVFPPTTSVLDDIEIDVVLAGPTMLFATPIAPPSFDVTEDGDIGGLFLGQSGRGRDLDRAFILGLGFTILEERARAGRTEFIVHGTKVEAQLISEQRFDEIAQRVPFFLYLLKPGIEITVKFILDSIDPAGPTI